MQIWIDKADNGWIVRTYTHDNRLIDRTIIAANPRELTRVIRKIADDHERAVAIAPVLTGEAS